MACRLLAVYLQFSFNSMRIGNSSIYAYDLYLYNLEVNPFFFYYYYYVEDIHILLLLITHMQS